MIGSRKSANLVGLDVEAGSVAATEVSVNGVARLGRSGIAALRLGVTRDGEITDPEELSGVLKNLFAEHKLPKNVRVGIANQRVVVRTLRLPLIEKAEEIEAAIRFQAADQIPMPIEHAVIDWRVLDPSAELQAARQMDVVVVAARRETVTELARVLRAAGLKPVGIDVAAFAMIRALVGDLGPAPGRPESHEDGIEAGAYAQTASPIEPGRLFCNLGDVTNLAVARGSNCLFTRVAPFGIEGIAQKLAERRGMALEDARQWISHVGLERQVEDIEGDAEIISACREALTEGAAKVAGELRRSLDYYGTQEGAVAVEEIVACGAGTAIAGFPRQLERELGIALRVGRPTALADLGDATAARLTMPFGLALGS